MSMRSSPRRRGGSFLSKAVSLRTLVLVTVLSAVAASVVGFATALAITPDALTIHTSTATVPVTTCTLSAAADTYADQGSSGSNFGTAATLHVRSAVTLLLLANNKRSFARFDLSSCSIPAGARLVSARMKLFLSTAPAVSRTYEVHRITQSWGETSLTWSDQPSAAATATASAATGITSNATLEWDVLADVTAFVAGTATNNGWRVSDSAESSGTAFESRFSSRENGTAMQRPSLLITYYP